MKDDDYIKNRKKNLVELYKLMMDRDTTNRQIRKIQKELTAWDRGLILLKD